MPRDTKKLEVYTGRDLNRDSAYLGWHGGQIYGKFVQKTDFIKREAWKKKGIVVFRQKLHFLFDNNDNNKL